MVTPESVSWPLHITQGPAPRPAAAPPRSLTFRVPPPWERVRAEAVPSARGAEVNGGSGVVRRDVEGPLGGAPSLPAGTE